MLASVEWGEKKICELFDSSNGNTDIQKQHINGKGEYVITSGFANNGIAGKSDVEARIFDEKTITVDMFGNAFYRNFKYKMVTHARVFSLKPKFTINNRIGLYLASTLHWFRYKYSYDSMCSWEKIKDSLILLPVRNGEIDFDFIERFIAKVEYQRVVDLDTQLQMKLESYLEATGLKDYQLTLEEQAALADFNNIQWREIKISELFNSSNGDTDIQKKHINGTGYYVITSGLINDGIAGKSDVEARIFDEKTITVDMFGNAFYRNFKYKMVTHARVFSLKPKFTISNNQGLYITNTLRWLNRIYNYDYMCSWEKIKDALILLPSKGNQIDFDYMEVFIRAVEKLVIRGVVEYSKQIIEATKQVCAR